MVDHARVVEVRWNVEMVRNLGAPRGRHGAQLLLSLTCHFGMKNPTEPEKTLENVETRETAESTKTTKQTRLASTQLLIVNIRRWFCCSRLPSQFANHEQCDGRERKVQN